MNGAQEPYNLNTKQPTRSFLLNLPTDPTLLFTFCIINKFFEFLKALINESETLITLLSFSYLNPSIALCDWFCKIYNASQIGREELFVCQTPKCKLKMKQLSRF